MRSSAMVGSRVGKAVYVVIFGLGLYFVASLSRNLVDFTGLDERMVMLEDEVAVLEGENRQLQEDTVLVDDEGYVRAVIRDKLGLSYPGESIVILPNEYLQRQVEFDEGRVKGEVEVVDNLENWEKWQSLFF